MKQIIEEYGESVAAVIAALVIIGIAVFLFTGGGIFDSVFSQVANSAI